MAAMDETCLQLQQSLRESINRALTCRRPVLTHLNADTTWLLQLPYPRDAAPPKGRSHFNILIDPWLKGPQVDVGSWLSKQWHSKESSVTTIVELNESLKEIENQVMMPQHDPHGQHLVESFIDAVIISHEFTDHCHKDTLLEIDPETPVFATKIAADSIRSWGHFKLVQEIPLFSEKSLDWTKTSLVPMPKWLGVSRIVAPGTNILYFHSAILIAFDLDHSACMDNKINSETPEAIIYTPHGIDAQNLHDLSSAIPQFQTLALLHGLHDVTISSFTKLNLGAYNGLRALRTCKAKYWISTHDEVKEARGLIASLLKFRLHTFDEAIEHERGSSSDEDRMADTEQTRFAELRNGESLLLS